MVCIFAEWFSGASRCVPTLVDFCISVSSQEKKIKLNFFLGPAPSSILDQTPLYAIPSHRPSGRTSTNIKNGGTHIGRHQDRSEEAWKNGQRLQLPCWCPGDAPLFAPRSSIPFWSDIVVWFFAMLTISFFCRISGDRRDPLDLALGNGRPTHGAEKLEVGDHTAQRRDRSLSFGDMMPFITKEGGKFLMKVILQIGVQGVTQRHHNSFFLSYRGLAKSGHNILSKSGITSSYTAYTNWLKIKKESIAIQGRSDCSDTMRKRQLVSVLITCSSHFTP